MTMQENGAKLHAETSHLFLVVTAITALVTGVFTHLSKRR